MSVTTEVDGDRFVLDALVTDPTTAVGERLTLRGSRCATCGRVEFPALPDCPADGGTVEVVALGPDARLAGFTEVLHAPPGAEVDVPYTLAVAAFDEVDLSILGRLDTHVDSADLSIGQPIEVVMTRFNLGRTYGYRLR